MSFVKTFLLGCVFLILVQFKLDAQTYSTMIALMARRENSVDSSLISKEQVNQLLTNFKRCFQGDKKTNSTGIKKMIRIMEIESKKRIPDIDNLSVALKAIACDRQNGGLSSGLSKVALFSKGRDRTIVQPLYNLISEPRFRLTRASFTEIMGILATSSTKPKP